MYVFHVWECTTCYVYLPYLTCRHRCPDGDDNLTADLGFWDDDFNVLRDFHVEYERARGHWQWIVVMHCAPDPPAFNA